MVVLCNRVVVSVGIFLCIFFVADLVRADESALRSARQRFQSGVEAVERGELARAADDFEAAYRLSPKPIVLYNLGQTQSALGRPVEAIRALRAYLRSDPPPDPERAREVAELIRANERLVGVILLDVVPPSAKLEVDGKAVTLESGKLQLAAGRHVVVAELDGYAPGILKVDVTAGSETRARLELEPVRTAAPARAQSSRPDALTVPPSRSKVARKIAGASSVDSEARRGAPSTPSIVAFTAIGLGAAALVTGTVFALTANDLDNAARSNGHCDSRTCDDVGLPLRREARRRGDVATGLFIAAGALSSIGITISFLIGSGAEPRKRAGVHASAR